MADDPTLGGEFGRNDRMLGMSEIVYGADPAVAFPHRMAQPPGLPEQMISGSGLWEAWIPDLGPPEG
ncbi:hypothetical protein ERC79_01610 [Rhodococcus sp. ABRD24]|uniref:hypothetical protein n=1 Tax=Rhodococcus sp. ABRD24 TaxID=2507582 RepID=UPI001040AF0F|nr:hypothetical protein [Rhodococcus sp. ABRD24]QBJ94806.1 hypothetical protein ERC79_01610 [Rhodococcus sp. ABRD24]